MDLIAEGLKKKLIRFEDDGKYIVYLHQKKRRNYSNPEEKVQALTFLSLVLEYQYPVQRITQFVPVQMGSETKEADIIVYEDDQHEVPLIVVECKKEEVSELEFARAEDQAVSYAVSEGAKFVWTTSHLKNSYFEIPNKKPKARITITDVPRCGIKKLAPFKYAKNGGKTKEGQQLFPLEKVSEDELTRRFKQAHQALWGGGELNPSEAFDELDKLIFCKIWDERKLRKDGKPYDFQVITVTPTSDTEKAKQKAEEESTNQLHSRLKKLYAEGRKKDPEVFKDEIRLSPKKARTVVGYLEGVDLLETDLDSKGRAFETFMGSFFRGDFGQYFTPRPIVKFIVDVLPIDHESLVLDTSCGSGGFLLHALDKVREQAGEYFKEGTDKHFQHWHDFAEKRLFGIEINEQIARTAKMNMIIHDDGHTNVIACDGLLPAEDLKDHEDNVILEGVQTRTGNTGFAYNRFDFIITNPPFGSKIRQTEKAYFKNYRMAQKVDDWLKADYSPTSPEEATHDKNLKPGQDTEILFIEQCWNYLKEGGYLAIVIPDGILTNSSLQSVRDNIEELYRILAVVSMPQTAFTANGAGVKSSVLFLRKNTAEQTKHIQDTKQALKDSIREETSFKDKLKVIAQEKKLALKQLNEREDFQKLTTQEKKENENYQSQKKGLTEEFKAKEEKLRYQLSETYEERRRKGLPDYDIFMAIADDIGYDATGRETGNNELEGIGKELVRFIVVIEGREA